MRSFYEAAANNQESNPRHIPAALPLIQKGHLNLSKFARGCDFSRTTVYKYLSLLEV